MSETQLKVHEIFYSIQGESSLAGTPMVFVRLANCNLRCTWCDTRYAYWKAYLLSMDAIVEKIKEFSCSWVCVTGGEPLGQKGTLELLSRLSKEKYKISLETNGSFSIANVGTEIKKILDLKCPESGESESMVWENIQYLTKNDEVKFVVNSKNDFEWARDIDAKFSLSEKCLVLFSPVYGKVGAAELACWILDSKAAFRMQTQAHKEIWSASQTGV